MANTNQMGPSQNHMGLNSGNVSLEISHQAAYVRSHQLHQQHLQQLQHQAYISQFHPAASYPNLQHHQQQLQQQQANNLQQEQQLLAMNPQSDLNPPSATGMVTDVTTISSQMLSLMSNLRGTTPYQEALPKLSLTDKVILSKTTVFKFAPRKVHDSQEKPGLSPQADFFISALSKNKAALIQDLGVLVGLRCSFCAQSPQYLPGATNFVALCQGSSSHMLRLAMDGRRRHILNCPYADKRLKDALGNGRTKLEEKNLEFFLNLWHGEVVPKYFEPTGVPGIPNHAPPRHVQRKPPPAGPQPRISHRIPKPPSYEFDEMEELTELERSFAKSQNFHHQVSKVLVEDLTTLPSPMDTIETPFVEILLQSLEIATQTNGKNILPDVNGAFAPGDDNGRELCVRCRYCHGLNDIESDSHLHSSGELGVVAVPGILTADSDAAALGNLAANMLEMGSSHYKYCLCMPSSIRDLLASCRPLKQTRPDLDCLQGLLSEWSNHLQRWYVPQLAPSTTIVADADLWGPVFDRKILHAWSSSLAQAQETARSRPAGMLVPDLASVHENDVVVNDEFLRELEGNRRFRRLISEHRGYYFDCDSPEQEEIVAQTLADVVRRRGGSFFSFEPHECESGRQLLPVKLSAEQILAHVSRSLNEGFPELLRPPMPPSINGTGTRVTHLERAPFVGRLHRAIRWSQNSGDGNDADNAMNGAVTCLPTKLERNVHHYNKSKAGGRNLPPDKQGGNEPAEVSMLGGQLSDSNDEFPEKEGLSAAATSVMLLDTETTFDAMAVDQKEEVVVISPVSPAAESCMLEPTKELSVLVEDDAAHGESKLNFTHQNDVDTRKRSLQSGEFGAEEAAKRARVAAYSTATMPSAENSGLDVNESLGRTLGHASPVLGSGEPESNVDGELLVSTPGHDGLSSTFAKPAAAPNSLPSPKPLKKRMILPVDLPALWETNTEGVVVGDNPALASGIVDGEQKKDAIMVGHTWATPGHQEMEKEVANLTGVGRDVITAEAKGTTGANEKSPVLVADGATEHPEEPGCAVHPETNGDEMPTPQASGRNGLRKESTVAATGYLTRENSSDLESKQIADAHNDACGVMEARRNFPGSHDPLRLREREDELERSGSRGTCSSSNATGDSQSASAASNVVLEECDNAAGNGDADEGSDATTVTDTWNPRLGEGSGLGAQLAGNDIADSGLGELALDPREDVIRSAGGDFLSVGHARTPATKGSSTEKGEKSTPAFSPYGMESIGGRSSNDILDTGGVEEVAFEFGSVDGTFGAYGVTNMEDALSPAGTGLGFYPGDSSVEKDGANSSHIFQERQDWEDDLMAVVDVDGSVRDHGAWH